MISSSSSHPDGPEILRQYATILKRRRALIAAFALAGLLLGAAAALLKPGKFAGVTTLVTRPIAGETPPGGGRSRDVNLDTEVVNARSEEVIATAAAALGLPDGRVRRSTAVEAAPFGNAMFFTFRDSNAKQAAVGADAYATAYLKFREARGLAVLNAQRDELEGVVADLQKKLADKTAEIDELPADDLNVAVLRQTRDVIKGQLDEASTKLARIDKSVDPGQITKSSGVPDKPEGLALPVSLLGGLFAGLLIGLFAAFIRDRLDRRFLALDDPSRIGLRELGAVPEHALSGVGNLQGDLDAQHTLLRVLLHLARLAPVQGGMSVLVTAPDHESVPSLAGLLQGLAQVAKSNGDSAAVMQVSWAAVFGDSLGRQSADGRWEQIRGVMEQMTSRNRYVFVDPPPLDRSADTLAVAAQVDLILLVVSDRTPVESVVRAKEELAGIGRKVAGYVRIRRVSRRKPAEMKAAGRIPTAIQVDPEHLDSVNGSTDSPRPPTHEPDPLAGRQLPGTERFGN